MLGLDYPGLRIIASQDKGGRYLQRILSIGGLSEDDRFVLTFEALVRDRKFVTLMRTVLARLRKGTKRQWIWSLRWRFCQDCRIPTTCPIYCNAALSQRIEEIKSIPHRCARAARAVHFKRAGFQTAVPNRYAVMSSLLTRKNTAKSRIRLPS
ncbi:MAG: hypothetical protein R3D55_07770 [Chloroflexota bacterium]